MGTRSAGGVARGAMATPLRRRSRFVRLTTRKICDRPPLAFSVGLAPRFCRQGEKGSQTPSLETISSRQTGFMRPEWVALRMARLSALLTGYAGRVGDREAIEPEGGDSPLKGGADGCDLELSTECGG